MIFFAVVSVFTQQPGQRDKLEVNVFLINELKLVGVFGEDANNGKG